MLSEVFLNACIIKEQSIDDFLGIHHLLQHEVPRGPLSALAYRAQSSVHSAAGLKAEVDVADEETLVVVERCRNAVECSFISGWRFR